MNQQRSRRFRSAQEAVEKEKDAAEFVKLLEQQRGTKVDESLKNKKVWDSNAITPGTPFMDILAVSLRYWCAYKLNTDLAWSKVTPVNQQFQQTVLTETVESHHFRLDRSRGRRTQDHGVHSVSAF